ncbi:MAG: hypothetical protein ACHQXG_07830, partial [Nitrososphaerales archaeon]
NLFLNTLFRSLIFGYGVIPCKVFRNNSTSASVISLAVVFFVVDLEFLYLMIQVEFHYSKSFLTRTFATNFISVDCPF